MKFCRELAFCFILGSEIWELSGPSWALRLPRENRDIFWMLEIFFFHQLGKIIKNLSLFMWAFFRMYAGKAGSETDLKEN